MALSVSSSLPHQTTDKPSDHQSVSLPFLFRFAAFPALALTLYPFFVMGYGGEHWAVQAAWIVVLTFCWFCVGGAFHEASHGTLFASSYLNRFAGQKLGMMIGIPYTVYQETHRRHHAYLNTASDYELWPYSDPTTSIGFRRFFVWIDLLLGIITAPWIYGRIYFFRDSRLGAETRKKITSEYIVMAVFWGILVGGTVWYLNSQRYDWSQFRLVWLLPMMLSASVNTARKFVEHLGLTSEDPMLGTRTVSGGNLASRFFRYLNFDISTHGPHHRFPKADPEDLTPRLHEYQQANPDNTVPVFDSYLAAFFHVLPDFWKNPATGTGQVPQVDRQSPDVIRQ